jgi:hypothetical protein
MLLLLSALLCNGACPSLPDRDKDGVPDDEDACPDDPLQWSDADGDGRCDEVDDPCPDTPLPVYDANGDGVCDGLDDSDGDGLSDLEEVEAGADCAVSDPLLADSDGDGDEDPHDPWPRDPHREFLLHHNDQGTIDLQLSNRDGSYAAPVLIGEPHGGTGNEDHQYWFFSVSDYDADGRLDFLALAEADPPPGEGDTYELWWFWREGGEEVFRQRLIGSVQGAFVVGAVVDLDGDQRPDMVHMEYDRPGLNEWVEGAVLYSYLNRGDPATATCVASDDPANPEGCLFVRVPSFDLNGWLGQFGRERYWRIDHSRQGADVTGDGVMDLMIYYHPSSDELDRAWVYLLEGRGDGTFHPPPGNVLFRHNLNGFEGPANILFFADFDEDGLADVLMGLDDDGDAGSAWFYRGRMQQGAYSIVRADLVEAFDLNPLDEGGLSNPGKVTRGFSLDVDLDGVLDLVLGWQYEDHFVGPSETTFVRGLGDGTFAAPTPIRNFPTDGELVNYNGQRFAAPQRWCRRAVGGP